jgi:hypothetical protein
VAFGIKRRELMEWKRKVAEGQIAFLTHYWLDDRFPNYKTVTKVGCRDLEKLILWGKKHGLKPEWIDGRNKDFPHYDLLGERQVEILTKEGLPHLIWDTKK